MTRVTQSVAYTKAATVTNALTHGRQAKQIVGQTPPTEIPI